MADIKPVTIICAADLPYRAAEGQGSRGLRMARLYQAPGQAFTFQIARIEPGGVSRRHQHAWEQVNWVAGGAGQVEAGGITVAINAGDCLIFPGGVEHAISNTGQEPLVLVAVLGAGAA